MLGSLRFNNSFANGAKKLSDALILDSTSLDCNSVCPPVKSLNEVDESTLKYDGYVAVEVRNAAGIVVLSFNKDSKFQFEPYVKPDESYAHSGASMFQMPTPPAIDLPEAKKAFSVEDLPFNDGAQKTDDLPF